VAFVDIYGIVLLSVQVAVVAVICALPLAFAVAWVLARKNFPGKSLLQALVTLPLVIPPVVTGFLLLDIFGSRGWGGQFLETVFGLTFAFRWTGAALAAAIMSFPLLVRPIQLSLEAIDQGLVEAARTLGASRMAAFVTVTLPLAFPGVISGAVLGFAKALGEFGATITFVANIPGETQTLSLAIYSLMQSPDGDAEALWLIWISIIIGFVAVLVSEWLGRKARWEERPANA
jgi:molybdate transport system permease protein